MFLLPDIVGDGSNTDSNLVSVTSLLHVAGQSSDREGRPVYLGHEESPQDDLVELGIGPPCQEPEKTWMTRENLGITKNETTLLTCRA